MKSTPPDPRSPNDAWDEQHQLLGNRSWVWLSKAESLMAAFEIVADSADQAGPANTSPRVDGIAYMLAGFALENLLKGQLVARHAHIDAKGRFAHNHHGLRQLASDAGYQLLATEDRLLERLEQYTVWAARYPVPLKPEEMRPRPTPKGGLHRELFIVRGKIGPPSASSLTDSPKPCGRWAETEGTCPLIGHVALISPILLQASPKESLHAVIT